MGMHLSTSEEKVQWLVKNRTIWRGWPVGEHIDRAIKEGMRRDGLISPGAHDYDIQDFGKLIAEARSRLSRKMSGIKRGR